MEKKTKKFYASLQPSEMAIFNAAAKIYASYIVAGQVTDSNEDEMMIRCIRRSIRMAAAVDQCVQSDSEVE